MLYSRVRREDEWIGENQFQFNRQYTQTKGYNILFCVNVKLLWTVDIAVSYNNLRHSIFYYIDFKLNTHTQNTKHCSFTQNHKTTKHACTYRKSILFESANNSFYLSNYTARYLTQRLRLTLWRHLTAYTLIHSHLRSSHIENTYKILYKIFYVYYSVIEYFNVWNLNKLINDKIKL